MSDARLMQEREEREADYYGNLELTTPIWKVTVLPIGEFKFARDFRSHPDKGFVLEMLPNDARYLRRIEEGPIGARTLKCYPVPEWGTSTARMAMKRQMSFVQFGGSDYRIVTLGQIYALMRAQASGCLGFLSVDGGITNFSFIGPENRQPEDHEKLDVYFRDGAWHVRVGITFLGSNPEFLFKDNRTVRAF